MNILKYFYLLGLTAFLFISCEPINNKTDDGPKVVRDKNGRIIEGPVKHYYPNNKLKAKMYVKNGKLQGKAYKYYDDGKTLRSELIYEKGKLNGVQKKYYKSGKLYAEMEYKMGVKDGIVKKYRENGKLKSEAVYKNGFAGTGLEEYLVNGKLKTKYPKIMVRKIDHLSVDGSYKIQFYLSDKSKNVTFYLGKLKEGRFLHEGLKKQVAVNGVYTVTYYLRPGDFVMKELDIVAKKVTRLNNTYITTKKYKVGIEYPRY